MWSLAIEEVLNYQWTHKEHSFIGEEKEMDQKLKRNPCIDQPRWKSSLFYRPGGFCLHLVFSLKKEQIGFFFLTQTEKNVRHVEGRGAAQAPTGHNASIT